jgi:GT2 family glycosyltransferase
LISVDVVVVSPDLPDVQALCLEFGHRWLPDPGSQAEAINWGIDELGFGYFAVGWLNDDDQLEPHTAHRVLEVLKSEDVVLAYGACRYVNSDGFSIGTSRAGRLAPFILPWGPDLIPQPGMLARAEAWRHVGGLDTSFRLAFDLDLLLRLKRLGALRYVNCVVSRFMWHPESLTVDNRDLNIQESERARRRALPERIRWMAPLWEKPAQGAVRIAAAGVNRRAQSAGAVT